MTMLAGCWEPERVGLYIEWHSELGDWGLCTIVGDDPALLCVQFGPLVIGLEGPGGAVPHVSNFPGVQVIVGALGRVRRRLAWRRARYVWSAGMDPIGEALERSVLHD